MELNNIKPTDNWGQSASNINDNFNKTNVEVEKIRYLTSKGKGLYATEASLKAAIPSPKNGDWAIVGTTVPGPLWSASAGVWSATGESGGVGNVDLAGYATSEEVGKVKTISEESKTAATAAKSTAEAAAKVANTAKTTADSAIEAAKDAGKVAITANEKATEAKTTADNASASAGALLVAVQKSISLINVNALCGDVVYTLTTALVAISEKEAADALVYKKSGLVITYRTDNGYETKQFTAAIDKWSNESSWTDFGGGGGSGAGNVYNVTELVPIETGYYTLQTAISAIPVESQRKGLVVTFESAQGKWLSYQFVGTSLDSFTAVSSWGEFGGAGTVKQITLNEEKYTPDEQGNLTLFVDEIQVDETLTPTGTNPVQGQAIYSAIDGIETGAALLLNTLGEGDDKAYSLSLLDKNGEILSTTETFTGGGGGGQQATTKIVLTRITENPTVKAGDLVKLQFMYDQIDTTSGNSTGNPGQAVITVIRGATSSTIKQTLASGSTTTLDVSKYIGVGNNTVRVRVTVGEGAEQQVSSIAWSVNVVDLKLTSSFNIATVINKGDSVSIPFSLLGSGSKTLRLYIDGVDTEDRTIGTSSSNGSFVVPTAAMAHGSHAVQLVAELDMSDGKKILSNSIYFDIAVRAGGDNPIIATRFDYPDGEIISKNQRPYVPVRQYDEYTISYAAHNPKEVPTKVDVYEAGVLISSAKVLFVRTSLKLRAMNSGTVSCRIECGSLTYAYGLQVSKSDLNLSEPTDNLILKLSALGRTNSDVNREEWKYNEIGTKLENFKFGGDGWIDNALRITGSARATVQLMPLRTPEQNVTNAFSFSIRLQVTDVMNEEAEVVRCMDENGTGFVITTQEARMVTRGKSRVAMKFATAEVYNIGFVSHPAAGNESTDYGKTNDSMVYLYINGIMSGGVQRGKSDSIYQVTPQFINIGSSECTTDVYGMRAYSVALTDAQMLDAYIVDLSTADELINKYNENNVLDDNGQITIDSLPEDMPYMIVTGVQPNGIPTLIHAAVMNNKKTKFNIDQIMFVWKSKAYQNFVCFGGCISLQGTSSLAYPIKNYRFYLKDSNKVPGIMYLGCDVQGVGGTIQEKPLYSLTMQEQGTGNVSVPVDCFCGKADYAESSSSHNTGMAKLVNNILESCGILTPAQQHVDKNIYQYDVRTTVEGYPVMLFYRNTVNDTPVFAGKFNLNNDKSTEDVFGFKGITGYHDADWLQEKFGGKNPTECWEFLNNDYPMGMFLDDDFDSKDEEGVPNWLKVFEARFPDDDDINAEYEAGTRKPENLMRLVKWIKSTKGNGAKFKAEVDNYFDVEFLCAYYMFTEIMGCVDQRVKNMMFGFWYDPSADKVLCYPIFYDCDTILGVRNDGRLKYSPFIDHNSIDPELTTSQKTVYAYAGHDSVLWENLREQCKVELDAVYKKMRAKMTNDTLFNMFDTEQSAKFCERVYNLDAIYKYVSPKTNGVDVINNGQVTTLTYSYMEAMQGSRVSHRHWWVNNRMSLFDARYMTGQYLSTDLTFKGNSAAGAVIKATPIRDFYFAFSREGSIMTHVAVPGGKEWVYTYGNMANIGTIFHFYGGEFVHKLNLSLWGGFTDINLPYMPKLQELTLGVDGREYQLSELTIGTKLPMLTHLMMRNYTKLPSLDLSRSTRLLEFDGKGCTSLSVVNFAEGAPLTRVYYPANYQTVKLLYLTALKRSGITFERIGSVTGLWVENCANLDAMSLMDELSALKHVRITGLNLTGNGDNLKRWFESGIGGMDSMGNTVSQCKLCGTYQLTNYLDDTLYEQFVKHFDELTILQPPYTAIEFDDSIEDPANVSNLDNHTGYKFGNNYQPSGHITKILNARHRYLGKNTAIGEVTICQLHDENSNYFADHRSEVSATPAILTGGMGDVYVREPHYWYKGVNDLIGKKKYTFFSSSDKMPSVAKGVRMLLSDCDVVTSVALSVNTELSTLELAKTGSVTYDSVSVPVSGYTRVRFPSILSGAYGALFTDQTGKIVGRAKAATDSGILDGMYCFSSVPATATHLHTTVSKAETFDCIYLTNSTDVEAMEPDWVEHRECLVGAYGAVIVNDLLKSVSGKYMIYNDDSFVLAISARGSGFGMASYEVYKDCANLFLSKYGTRNSQHILGYCSPKHVAQGFSNAYGIIDSSSEYRTNGGEDALAEGQYIKKNNVNYRIEVTSGMCYEGLLSPWIIKGIEAFPPNKTVNIVGRKIFNLSFFNRDVFTDKIIHARHCDILTSLSAASSTTRYCDQSLFANQYILYKYGTAGYFTDYNNANLSRGGLFSIAFRDEQYGFSGYARLLFTGTIKIENNVSTFKNRTEI